MTQGRRGHTESPPRGRTPSRLAHITPPMLTRDSKCSHPCSPLGTQGWLGQDPSWLHCPAQPREAMDSGDSGVEALLPWCPGVWGEPGVGGLGMWGLRKAGGGRPCNIWASSAPAWLLLASLTCRACPRVAHQACPGCCWSPPSRFHLDQPRASPHSCPGSAVPEECLSSCTPGQSDHGSLLWVRPLLAFPSSRHILET